MAYLDETYLSTEEYGLIEIGRLHKYKLDCNVLVFDENSKDVNFIPIGKINVESRKINYIVSTLKFKRIISSADQLFYSKGTWKIPSELEVGEEIWTNESKSPITDIITEVKIQHNPTRFYYVDFPGNISLFANKILVKESRELGGGNDWKTF